MTGEPGNPFTNAGCKIGGSCRATSTRTSAKSKRGKAIGIVSRSGTLTYGRVADLEPRLCAEHLRRHRRRSGAASTTLIVSRLFADDPGNARHPHDRRDRRQRQIDAAKWVAENRRSGRLKKPVAGLASRGAHRALPADAWATRRDHRRRG